MIGNDQALDLVAELLRATVTEDDTGIAAWRLAASDLDDVERMVLLFAMTELAAEAIEGMYVLADEPPNLAKTALVDAVLDVVQYRCDCPGQEG